MGALTVEPLAPRVPAREQPAEAEGEREREVAPGLREAEQEGEDGEHREQAPRRVEHAVVLGGPAAHDAGVARPAGHEGHGPGDAHEHGQDHVGDAGPAHGLVDHGVPAQEVGDEHGHDDHHRVGDEQPAAVGDLPALRGERGPGGADARRGRRREKGAQTSSRVVGDAVGHASTSGRLHTLHGDSS
ncbi:Uncharacterised protein [Mycobacteroides abscessus]|nr:Uncharacterised protein [Mycobacteroides abscessus]